MRRFVLVFAGLILASATGVTHSLRAATLTVTNVNDSGAGSLRQAIIDANGMGGADTIAFNIPGSGRHTIDLLSALPAITESVNLDGGTQPGFDVNNGAQPQIELNGSAVPAPNAVLTLSAGSSTIMALVITHGQDAGIRITTGAGNHIAYCAVGTITRNSSLQKDVPGTGNLGPGIDVVGGTDVFVETSRIALNGSSGIVVRAGASGVHMSQMELYSNNGLQIDLNGDGPTPNDVGDGDTGGNTLLNSPILERIDFTTTQNSLRKAYIYGRIEAAPLTAYSVRLFFGRIGANNVFEVTTVSQNGTGLITTDASGNASFNFGTTVETNITAVALVTLDAAQNMSEFSNPLEFPDIAAESGCGACGLEWLIVPLLAALRRRRWFMKRMSGS